MAQQPVKNKTAQAQVIQKKLAEEPIKFSYIFFLIAYGFVTVLTPNWMTFDSNGPKFMTLSFLNVIVFFFLFGIWILEFGIY